MPRFGDQWVIDRTHFEYCNGGSCACCGFNHFLPGGTKDVILAMSDLETDAANAEVSALDKSPWPPAMRDQVWGDRLKLRHLMKREMMGYKQFWKDHGVELEEWCRQQSPHTLKRIFQMPRSEITERVRTQYGIHSAFAVVICTVVEQVANFPLTKLPTDGRGASEIAFEEALLWDRRGGFTLDIKNKEDGSLNEEVLQIWLERMKTLGGPKLLERAPRVRSDSDSEDEAGDVDDGLKKQDEDDQPSTSTGPSFQPDRRIIRLMIARYWADIFQKKFLEDLEKKREAAADNSNNKEGPEGANKEAAQE
jgi:hypothetical protein